MEGIIQVYNHVTYFLILIFVFVSWWIYRILLINKFNKTIYFLELKYKFSLKELIINFKHLFLIRKLNILHNTWVEFFWTTIPAIVLYLIAIPSFLLLYSMDEIINPSLTIKIIGNQWYWEYEYTDYLYLNKDININFDSYMVYNDDLLKGEFRLLEVDNPIVLPIYTHIRLLVTANDVLHSWAVPSLGIKIDAVPGRLNQGSIFLKRLGIFYGQCSEICGVNHGFMPIVIKSVSLQSYLNWLINISLK